MSAQVMSTPPPPGDGPDVGIEPGAAASTAPPKPTNLGRKIVLGVLLGVAIYGAIVIVGGVKTLEDELARFAWPCFAIACGLALANYLIRFIRWEYYLRILDIRGVPKLESLLIFFSGFVLTITPGKIGEVFKSYVLYERRGVSIVRTAPIVVAERLTDLIGVIAIITVGGASFRGGLFWAALGFFLVAMILVAVTVPAVSTALLSPLPALPLVGRFFGRLVPRIELALVELRAMTKLRHLLVASSLSVVGWSLEGVGVFFILRGLGAQPVLLQTVFFYGTATCAGALVPVPGGLGVVEKVLQESMVRIGGIPTPIAMAAMLLGRLATLWFAVALGFLSLGLLRLRRLDKA
jgi:uncharacterized membrane protein YbhN (UPF0104 family)